MVAALVPDASGAAFDQHDAIVSIDCPVSLRRRGVEMRMVITNSADQHRQPDAGLVQLVLKAHRYLALLVDGQNNTISDVAAAEGVEASEVSRILPLAFLSPVHHRQHPRWHPTGQPDPAAPLPAARPASFMAPAGRVAGTRLSIGRPSRRCSLPNTWNQKQASRDRCLKMASLRREMALRFQVLARRDWQAPENTRLSGDCWPPAKLAVSDLRDR